MKLKKNGAKLVNFVVDFVNGDVERGAFDLDYAGYVIECFPKFEKEHPRLARRFADTVDRSYDDCVGMQDDELRDAIADALDVFMGIDNADIL